MSDQPADGQWQPIWLPEGSKIAFVHVQDGNLATYVMNADGSNPIAPSKRCINYP